MYKANKSKVKKAVAMAKGRAYEDLYITGCPQNLGT